MTAKDKKVKKLMDQDAKLKVFNQERDAALLSLDEQRIRSFFRKFNGKEMSSNPEIFWGSVHKAITGNTGLPIEFRRLSKFYLNSKGLRSFDDGDL